MVCGRQDSSGVSCPGAGGGALEGSGKENYTSKVCYPPCTKAGTLREVKTDLCQGSCKPGTGLPTMTCFVLGMSTLRQCCVATLVSLGLLRPAMEASPELVKFSM